MVRCPPSVIETETITVQALANIISGLSSSKFGSGDSSPNNSIIKVSNRTCGTSEKENTASESSGSASADGLLVVNRHRTAKQVHSQMVKKKETKESAEHAYLAATQQIKNEKGSKITQIVGKKQTLQHCFESINGASSYPFN